MEMEIILKYSPFNTEEKLMEQFAKIESGMHNSCGPLIQSSRISLRFFFIETGTLVMLYNLKVLDCGETELDVKNDLELSNIFINLFIV